MRGDDEGQEHDIVHEPHIDILDVGGLGKGGGDVSVEGDEDEECGKAHGAPLRKPLHRQEQRAIPGDETVLSSLTSSQIKCHGNFDFCIL